MPSSMDLQWFRKYIESTNILNHVNLQQTRDIDRSLSKTEAHSKRLVHPPRLPAVSKMVDSVLASGNYTFDEFDEAEGPHSFCWQIWCFCP